MHAHLIRYPSNCTALATFIKPKKKKKSKFLLFGNHLQVEQSMIWQKKNYEIIEYDKLSV